MVSLNSTTFHDQETTYKNVESWTEFCRICFNGTISMVSKQQIQPYTQTNIAVKDKMQDKMSDNRAQNHVQSYDASATA